MGLLQRNLNPLAFLPQASWQHPLGCRWARGVLTLQPVSFTSPSTVLMYAPMCKGTGASAFPLLKLEPDPQNWATQPNELLCCVLSFPTHFSRPGLVSELSQVYLCHLSIWRSIRKSWQRRYKLQAKLHQSLFSSEKRNKTSWQKNSFTIPLPCIRHAIISWTLLQLWPKQRSGAIKNKLILPADWKDLFASQSECTLLGH